MLSRISKNEVVDAVLVICALIFILLITSTPFVADIDWDNAAHFFELERPENASKLRCFAYTAHMGLVPLYHAVASVLDASHLRNILAIRIVTCFGVLCGATALVFTLRRYPLHWLLRISLVLCWISTPVVMVLTRTFEDDAISLAVQGLLLVCCLGSWGFTRALISGVLVGAGAIINFSAVVLICVPVATCLYHALALRRIGALLGISLIFGGLLISLLIFGVYLQTCDISIQQYFAMLTASPNSLSSAWNTWEGIVGYLSLRIPEVTVPLLPTYLYATATGMQTAISAGMLLLLVYWAIFPFLKSKAVASEGVDFQRAIFSVSLLGTALPAIIKGDPTVYERMCYVPMFLVLLVSTFIIDPKKYVHLAGLILTVTMVISGLREINMLLRAQPPRSSFSRYAEIRDTHSNACRFVFGEREFADSNDYSKVVAYTVIFPERLTLTTNEELANWRYPPNPLLSVHAYTENARSCDKRTKSARRVLMASKVD